MKMRLTLILAATCLSGCDTSEAANRLRLRMVGTLIAGVICLFVALFAIAIAISLFQYLAAKGPKLVRWSWDTIQGFGRSRILATSYLILAVVPVAAKALASVPETITVPVFRHEVTIHTGLPFNWIVLFASSVFASLGGIIYHVRCPDFVKSFSDYQSFAASKRDLSHIAHLLMQLPTGEEHAKRIRQPPDLDRISEIYLDYRIEKDRFGEGVSSQDGAGREYGFYVIRDALNKSLPFSRLLSCVCYFLSFGLLSIIVYQNIVSVIRMSRWALFA